MPDAIAAQADFNVNRLRVLVGEYKFVGALLMGDQTLSRAIHHIIVDQIDISSIREKLINPDNSITTIIADFWRQLPSTKERAGYAAIKP
jgi:NAD(P)H-nitrite reductase large subunit